MRRALIVSVCILTFFMVSCSASDKPQTHHIPPLKLAQRSAANISALEASSAPKAEPLEPYIEKGTGAFVANDRPSRSISEIKGDKTLSLNFVDVEVGDLVGRILGDQFGLDYVIDPRVKGKITMRTSDELPVDDILSILDSVLNLNGAALLEDNGIYKVLPMDQVISSGISPEINKVNNVNRFGFGIEIVPVKFIDAKRILEIIQPILSSDSTIQINDQRNTVLLVGPRAELNTLVETIRIFDVDWMRGMSFGLFNLQHADATGLSRELVQLFDGFGDGTPTNTTRFIPIKRLNSIIVVATQPTYLDRARDWIERLDRAAEGSEEQIYFYSVQNGRAADLARVLSSIFEIEQRVIRSQDADRGDIDLAPGLNPIEFESSFDASELDFDEYATHLEETTQSANYNQQYSFPDGQKKEARIVADEINNSLLIRATPDNFKKIHNAIKELDVQPVQVLLEATIAEVTLADELSYGVQWFFEFGSGSATLSQLPTGIVDQVFPGFSGLFSSNDVRVIFDALDSVSDVRIISSPQILVLDNQTAQLEVGDEVPIVTQQAQGTGSSDERLISTIEQRQTGVILNVTPRVNASGLVVLDIQQEVSDVVQTTTSGIDSPTISQRRIGTSIAVGNRQTVALGGLIRDKTAKSRQGIPLLSAIPVVGSLFGTTRNLTSRTELLVLITPIVIRDHGEAQAVTAEFKKRFQAISPLERKLNKTGFADR